MRRVIIAALVAAAIGCGDADGEKVNFFDTATGKPAGSMTLVEPEILDLRQGKIVAGTGYIMDCGSARFPYSGESVLFKGEAFTSYCNAIGASYSDGRADPGDTWAFSFNEPFAKWQDGTSMDNNLRSVATKGIPGALSIKLHVATNQNTQFGGGGFHWDVGADQQKQFSSPDWNCPIGGNCSTSFHSGTSSYGHFIQAYP